MKASRNGKSNLLFKSSFSQSIKSSLLLTETFSGTKKGNLLFKEKKILKLGYQ